ncbi:hypothetical protein Tco_0491490 [Tanacetum coccineum]
MANQEQIPLQQEHPFVAAKQVSFNLEDIILNTNNEVAFLYLEHNNQDYFKCVFDFISKCCLRKPFTRSPDMYKEYMAEFWNAIGAHFLAHSSEYIALPSIDIVRQWFPMIRYREEVSTKGTPRKSLLPPSLANGINIDYANISWEDIILKLKKKQREKVIPYTRFISLLIMHKMKEGYGDDEVTLYPTHVFTPKPSSIAERVPQGIKPEAQPGYKKQSSLKQPYVSSKEATKGGSSKAPTGSKTGHSIKRKESSSAMDSNPSQPSVSTPSALRNDASAGSTAEADPGNSAPSTDPHVLAEQTKSVSEGLDTVLTQTLIGKGASSITRWVEEEEAFRTIKLEDLAKLVSNVLPSFKDLDSPEDDPVIIVESNAEEDDGIHATENVETDGYLSSMSSSPKELPQEFISLPRQVASVQAKLKTLDALPSLLSHVTKALNKFAHVLDSASSKAGDQRVPSVGQADTMHAKGEKNINQATIYQLF